MTDVAEIARGLTKAQRDAVITKPKTMLIDDAIRLLDLELVDEAAWLKGDVTLALTPLGLAVRAHLQENPK